MLTMHKTGFTDFNVQGPCGSRLVDILNNCLQLNLPFTLLVFLSRLNSCISTIINYLVLGKKLAIGIQGMSGNKTVTVIE